MFMINNDDPPAYTFRNVIKRKPSVIMSHTPIKNYVVEFKTGSLAVIRVPECFKTDEKQISSYHSDFWTKELTEEWKHADYFGKNGIVLLHIFKHCRRARGKYNYRLLDKRGEKIVVKTCGKLVKDLLFRQHFCSHFVHCNSNIL